MYGTVNDKNFDKIFRILPQDAEYYFCKPNLPRGLDEVVLRDLAYKEGLKGRSYSSVSNALTLAKKNATKDDLIFIGGSTFVVAEIV